MSIKLPITKYVLISLISLLLSSCGSVMRGGVTKQKEYLPLEQGAQFAIYNEPQQIPIEYEIIGKVDLYCYEFTKKTNTTKCDSVSVFHTAEIEAKKAGGNALLLKKYREPTILKSYYELHANVIKVFDFSSPPDLFYAKKKPRIFETYGKGTWDLRLTMPYINHFRLKPDGERDISSAGFLGAAIGFDYYHKNNQYLSVIAGGVIDFFLPFPAPVDYFEGEKEFCSSSFIGLTNNHRYKFLSFGYGLSYSHNSWRHRYFYRGDKSDDIPPDREYTDNTLGLMFTSYWLSKKSFGLGVIYRPNFYRLNASPSFKYEHLISIDFAWRIRLKTGSNKDSSK